MKNRDRREGKIEMGPYTIPVTGTTITTGGMTGDLISATATITNHTAHQIFTDYAPYITTDHLTLSTNSDEIDKIKDILSDICDLLADLYEKKRLGRDGDIEAIRAFIDSIKVTEE